jgi:two-component system, cell cycle sensor histidine kinase and response regulator CckA
MAKKNVVLFSYKRWVIACAWFALMGWANGQDNDKGPDKKNNSLHAMDSITIALKWQHQFQFAGYYAAVQQGYFAQEGLHVTLTTPQNNEFPLQAVPAGKAQYGVATSDILTVRAQGVPVVVVAAIFQHSPIALVSLAPKELLYPSSFMGKKVLTVNKTRTEIVALLLKEGIDPSGVRFTENPWGLEYLVNGQVHGMIGYITDLPFLLQSMGQQPRVLRGVDYGIDFYGDVLFTTEQEIMNAPQRVERVRRAVLKGWDYALRNSDSVVHYILNLPQVQERGYTLELLQYEAQQTKELIQPELVDLGHSNPERWQKIAQAYAAQGLMPAEFTVDGFLYHPHNIYDNSGSLVKALFIVLLPVLLGVFWFVWLARRKIKAMHTSKEQAEAFFKSISENLGDGFVYQVRSGTVDSVRHFVYVSAGVQFVTGYTPEQICQDGSLLYNTVHPDDSAAFHKEEQSAFANMRAFSIECRLFHINGAEHWVRITSIPHLDGQGFLVWDGIAIDITQQKLQEKALREQLHQAQKMDAVGQLAGGFAHDFNNTLGGILGIAEMLEEEPLSKQGAEMLALLQSTAQKASGLAKKLLQFSRRSTPLNTVVDCAKIVQDIWEMLKHSINKSIEIDLQNNAKNTMLQGDESLLQNAIMNIGINASHAMPQGGSLRFILDNVYLDQSFCAESGFTIEPGDYLKIQIVDTGLGMDKNVMDRIFEPFFTTKDQGQGTGLGLAMVYGTVQDHRGAITVHSQLGKGTTFILYFPISTKELAQVSLQKAPKACGKGTVLVIDDEELIRIVVSALLKSLGYEAITASDGVQGVQMYANKQSDIDIVILDMIMPELGGAETFAALQKINPQVAVIVASGFSKEKEVELLREKGVSTVLQKPFSKVELAAALNKAIKK